MPHLWQISKLHMWQNASAKLRRASGGEGVSEAGNAALARSAMAAVEPLVELFLELGITSPEAESLLRSLFIHKARSWLAESSADGTRPSDVRVSLVTGVHRNFVRRILAEPPSTAAARGQKKHRTARLLDAWYTDGAYLDSSGKPRDLFKRQPEPSFFTLASTYTPGAAPGVVLQELHRAGVVQLLPLERVRVRSRTFRAQGVNVAGVSELGSRSRELLQTLIHNLREPDARILCDSMSSIEVDALRVPVIRDVIARRAGNFLAAIEQELAIEASLSHRRKSKKRVRIGLTAFESEHWPRALIRKNP
jgi:hypothetical protein